MINMQRVVAGGMLALALAFAPTAGEAAWWPWSKKNERAAAPAPAPTPGDDSAAAGQDPIDRLARAEQKIRELNGQIEELAFQLRQTQELVARLQADSDARLAALENGKRKKKQPSNDDAAGGVVVIDNQADATATAAVPPAPAPVGAVVSDGTGGAPGDQPIDLTAAAPAEAAPAEAAPAVVASLGDPAADYENAYKSIITGDYAQAEAAFRQFLSTYPGDQRVPDAQYWLGESLFQRAQYREAADEFLAGYKAFPKSAKAADTLLKLGLSLAGLGEQEAACSTYAEVLKKYPQASKSLKQRVAAERGVAGCG